MVGEGPTSRSRFRGEGGEGRGADLENEMKHCNPLLKSWNRYLKDAATFVVLYRHGAGRLGSERRGRRIKRKARR